MKTTYRLILFTFLTVTVNNSAFPDTMLKFTAYTPGGEFLGNKVTEHEDTTTYWISGDKIRADGSTGTSFIYDRGNNTAYILHHKFKIYDIHKLDEVKAARDSTGKPIIDFEGGVEEIAPQLQSQTTSIDSTKIVEGYHCHKFILDETVPNAMLTINSHAEIWATEEIAIDLKEFYRAKFGLAKGVEDMDQYANQLRSIKGFPVSIVATVHIKGDEGRQSDIKTEERLIEFKETEVPASTFEIPKGYELYGEDSDKN